jgi:peptidoglycan/LPS O-acetylase OafA/YrhL
VNQVNYSKLPYRPEIDGLRALAVLSVVVFHFFPNWLNGGYLGVDIFFVISGFLITSQLINFANLSIKEILMSFYKRRIARLFPALFLFLLVTYFFVSFFFVRNDIISFENSLISAYTFWSNIFFWRDGGYFGGNDQLKPLLHIWSLSVEEQFYFFAPLTILLLLKCNKRVKYSVFLGVLGIVVLSFFLWLYMYSIGGQNPAFFLLPTRVWQFGLGALISINYYKPPYKFENTNFTKFLFSLFLALIFIGILSNVGSEIQTILVTVGTVGFIKFAHNNSSLLVKMFRARVALFLGRISYSLYLYHWPIAVGLTYYFIDKVPFFYALLGVFSSVILGWLSYSLIENKFRYSSNFTATLVFLLSCVAISFLLFISNSKNENSSFGNTISRASGTHYRCNISSYRPYGSSRACVVNKSKMAKKTIVLLGNSHAQMYVPLVEDIDLVNSNLLLVPLNGCLPTTSINISTKCMQMASRNLSNVLADKSVTSVLIATTWYSDSYVDINGENVSSDKLHPAMKDLVTKLKTHGKEPILFSPIPIPNKNYASELARLLHFKKISEKEAFDIIKVPRSMFDVQFSQVNDDFNKLLGNSYIRIYDEMCDQTYCYYGRDDVFYFADSNHLSQNAVTKFYKAKKQLRTAFESFD